jgi:dynein heavy chain
MQTLLPLISNLLNPAMQARHWTKILRLAGRNIDVTSPSTTFSDIIDLKLYNFEAEVNEIVDIAQKELKIAKQIKDIKRRWNRMNFEFKIEKDVPALDKLDDLQETLEIDQMQILSLSAQGKYVVEFKEELEKWREILSNIDTSIEVWLDLQKMWAKLVNIFMDTDDIRQNLPEETKMFEQLDSDWRDLQSTASGNPSVSDNCTKVKIATLKGMFEIISKCEAELTKYLEIKKKYFPRFYFLDSEALLDVLSNGNQPVKVAKYLSAVFISLSDLEFCKQKEAGKAVNQATGMYSKQHEFVKFDDGETDPTIFTAKGEVENWLCDLESMMRLSLER